MIPRYEKKEISSIWTDENKFKTYLKIELAILEALEGEKIPKGIAKKIRDNAVIDVDRINQIEAETKHDIIAFCTSITEKLPPEVGQYFHFGVTSSDIIDSSLTLQIKDSLAVILPAFKELLESLQCRALEMKDVICMGRSHGMFAEPLSFGQKLLGFYNELFRRYQELDNFFKQELTVQYSGAVGSFTILSPELEKIAADALGVSVEPLSTQVIPRDRIAKMVTINGLIGSAIERFAVELRHLHRSEVDELHEGFSKGQKGSSTMPHKKNPIAAENLTGMSRVLRSHVSIALENIVLWHERDISHSCAERLYLPDNLGLLYYALCRLKSTIDNLEFHRDKIEARVQQNHSYLSSFYLHFLIEKSELSREELYLLVQEATFKGHSENSAEVFYQTLSTSLKSKNVEINLPKPSFSEVKKIYLGAVDSVFKRSLEKYSLDAL